MSKTIGVILVSITIVIIILAAVFGASLLGTLPNSSTTTGTQTTQTNCSSGGCILALPIKFNITTMYSSIPVSTSGKALTVLKIGMPATSWETGDTGSDGTWVTTKTYLPDTSWFLYFNYGNAKYEFKFTVPRAQTATDKTLPVHLIVANIGSYSLNVVAPDGSTGTYNVTLNHNLQPKFTIIITNNADNTGITGSFQRNEILENGSPRKLSANIIVVTSSGKSRVVGQVGSTYELVLPDHAVDRQRNPDGTLNQNAQGKYSTVIQFDASKLTPGVAETITIYYYAYLDVPYFTSNGVVNSEAYLAGIFQFQISA